MLPRRCENSNNPNNTTPCPVDPFIILPDKSDFLDVQKLKLQETPEDIPTGEMPRHIWLFTERKLVNKVKPGSRVKIVGIYKIFDGKVGGIKNDRYDVSVRYDQIVIFFFFFFYICGVVAVCFVFANGKTSNCFYFLFFIFYLPLLPFAVCFLSFGIVNFHDVSFFYVLLIENLTLR